MRVLAWLMACATGFVVSNAALSEVASTSEKPDLHLEQHERVASAAPPVPTDMILIAQRKFPRRCRDIIEDIKDDGYALLYIASYPDLAKKFGRDTNRGRRHFEEFGCDEGRDITFDGLVYVAGYADLIQAIGMNEQKALDHFLQYGAKEGRTNNKFDAAAYANQYADLKTKFGNNRRKLAEHCIRYGRKEGRAFCG